MKVATKIILHVTLASSEDSSGDASIAGRILPPYLEIEYKTLGPDEKVTLSFEVAYHSNVSQVGHKKTIKVSNQRF